MYRKTGLNLTQAQMRAAANGKAITVKPSQMSGGSMYLHPTSAKKLSTAQKKNKGMRLEIAPGEINFDLDTLEGASLWSWLKGSAYPWLKKNWNVLKPVASLAADVAVPFLASNVLRSPSAAIPARRLLKDLTGVGVSGSRKLIKGSPEAKAYMASLRARRKGGSFKLAQGGSFKL